MQLSRHRFLYSAENTITPDYVTEKFFDPLHHGAAVPLYWGAPNVALYSPTLPSTSSKSLPPYLDMASYLPRCFKRIIAMSLVSPLDAQSTHHSDSLAHSLSDSKVMEAWAHTAKFHHDSPQHRLRAALDFFLRKAQFSDVAEDDVQLTDSDCRPDAQFSSSAFSAVIAQLNVTLAKLSRVLRSEDLSKFKLFDPDHLNPLFPAVQDSHWFNTPCWTCDYLHG